MGGGSQGRASKHVTTAFFARKRASHIIELTPIMALQNSAGEDIGMRRRRMRYRAWHRGTREMDLILGPYADAHIEGLGEAELDRLEVLMNEEDTDLLMWIMGQEPPRADVDAELLAMLAAFNDKRLAGI